jgi:hypothetical protein
MRARDHVGQHEADDVEKEEAHREHLDVQAEVLVVVDVLVAARVLADYLTGPVRLGTSLRHPWRRFGMHSR